MASVSRVGRRPPRSASAKLPASWSGRYEPGEVTHVHHRHPQRQRRRRVVTDLDLATLDDATWAEVYGAFLTHGLLVFPGQHLDEEAQGAFARRFGGIEKLYPGQDRATLHFGNVKADGKLTRPGDESFKAAARQRGLAYDSTYMPLAAKASMLMALVVPEEGGGTEFADMRAAYDALDPAMQEQLEGMSAYHSLYHSQARAGFAHTTDHMYGFHDKGAPLRPSSRRIPRRAGVDLHGPAAYRIEGMDPGESLALLERLLDDACQPPRTYLHAWTVGPGGLGQPLHDAPRPAVRHEPAPCPPGIADLRGAGVGAGADVRGPEGRRLPADLVQRVGADGRQVLEGA